MSIEPEFAVYFKLLSAYARNGVSVVSVPPSSVSLPQRRSGTEQNGDVAQGVQDTLELSWFLKHFKSFSSSRINHSK